MSARGRFLSCLTTAVIALAGFTTAGALPASANSRTVQYVALGDSYAAGQAAGRYPICPHSRDGYPALLDYEGRIDLETNATCSGATTSEVAETQLSAIDRDTRLVTLTVGGNDLGVSLVARTCITVPDDCDDAIRRAGEQLPLLGSHLFELYTAVAAKAPRARIVVTGYPHLFEPAPGTPNATNIDLLNESTDALNETIRQAVAAAQDADLNVHYVDVTAEFAGHGIGSPESESFINAAGQDAFHPNANGYIAYADAISATLPGAWVDKHQQHFA